MTAWPTCHCGRTMGETDRVWFTPDRRVYCSELCARRGDANPDLPVVGFCAHDNPVQDFGDCDECVVALQNDLDDLERNDPAVARAAARYREVRDSILAHPASQSKPRGVS